MSGAEVTEKVRSSGDWSDAVAAAIRQKDWDAACDAADHLMAHWPSDADCQTRALQAYVQAGRTEAAAALAETSRPHWAGAPRLAHLVMLAFGRNGQRVEAAEAARIAVAADPQNLRLAAPAADALTQAGRPSEAVVALEAAGVRQSDDPRAWYELARARHLAAADRMDALTDARQALSLAPENLRAVELVARLLLDLSMPFQAASLLEALPEGRRTTVISVLLVEAHAASNALDKAAPLARKLAEANGESFHLTRRLTGVLHRAGQTDLARIIYSGNLDKRRARLPQRFAEGAKALMVRADHPEAMVPQPHLDWLYGQLQEAGRAPADRKDWEREVRAVTALDRLILDWIECRPEALDQVTGIMDGVDAARQEVAAAQAEGKGVFLAAAHVGLLFGSLAALADSGLPMSFVASVPNLGHLAYDEHLVSTASHDEAAIGRALFRALRAGKVVSVAIEGAAASQKASYPLFDREIQLSPFIPRLAWKTGTPSFFPAAIWRGGRAQVSVTRLPDARDFPTAESFEASWTAAYLAALTSLLLDHPSSARATGGFWASITL